MIDLVLYFKWCQIIWREFLLVIYLNLTIFSIFINHLLFFIETFFHFSYEWLLFSCSEINVYKFYILVFKWNSWDRERTNNHFKLWMNVLEYCLSHFNMLLNFNIKLLSIILKVLSAYFNKYCFLNYICSFI
jgi:hypothetical protein